MTEGRAHLIPLILKPFLTLCAPGAPRGAVLQRCRRWDGGHRACPAAIRLETTALRTFYADQCHVPGPCYGPSCVVRWPGAHSHKKLWGQKTPTTMAHTALHSWAHLSTQPLAGLQPLISFPIPSHTPRAGVSCSPLPPRTHCVKAQWGKMRKGKPKGLNLAQSAAEKGVQQEPCPWLPYSGPFLRPNPMDCQTSSTSSLRSLQRWQSLGTAPSWPLNGNLDEVSATNLAAPGTGQSSLSPTIHATIQIWSRRHICNAQVFPVLLPKSP